MRTVAAGMVLPLSSVAFSQQTPPRIKVDSKEQLEQIVLEQSKVVCAKKGMVVLAEHLNGAFMGKCVKPDDPEYLKAQEAAKQDPTKPAQ